MRSFFRILNLHKGYARNKEVQYCIVWSVKVSSSSCALCVLSITLLTLSLYNTSTQSVRVCCVRVSSIYLYVFVVCVSCVLECYLLSFFTVFFVVLKDVCAGFGG